MAGIIPVTPRWWVPLPICCNGVLFALEYQGEGIHWVVACIILVTCLCGVGHQLNGRLLRGRLSDDDSVSSTCMEY